MKDLTKKAVDTLRAVSVEMISTANSGHSGIALGAAPIMYAAYASMKVDTDAPGWFNRDRFVMSAGHGSALLYSMLHLIGFDIPAKDLKTFRQLGSNLTGHPEIHTPGVDCATGPLGQGVAMSVGLALAEKKLAGMYNKEGLNIVDHYTYCLAGDGCLMEGVSYEACNLAGLWKLNKLIVLYDSNNVTLDGARQQADGEDVKKRFEACGWNVLEVADGNDANAIMGAIAQAKASVNAPTMIIVTTQIGFGAKVAGTAKAHGAVLTADETQALRKDFELGNQPFSVDSDVRKHFTSLAFKNLGQYKKWQETVEKYKKKFPEEYKQICQFWEKDANKVQFDVTADGKAMSLRDVGHLMLNQIAKQSPRLVGANADISSTTKAFIVGGGLWSPEKPKGTDIACGVREFAMAAVCNGLALHGFTPYCSTFLAFSDYCKAALRLSALMNLPITYIFTHDGLGNTPDGPTHQANEHISALRLVPNLTVFRPCDDFETAAAYKWVFESRKPACIILGRGNVPSINETEFDDVARGGYVISDCDGRCSAVLVSSGAEVSICMAAQELLRNSGLGVRVVSVPSFELFDAQSAEYRANVLGGELPKVAIEMGRGDLWYKYIGNNGTVIGFDKFGASGSGEQLNTALGFTAENIAKTVLGLLKK